MNIREQSYVDLEQDAGELRFLVEDLHERLKRNRQKLIKHQEVVELSNFNYLTDRVSNLDATLVRLLDDLKFFIEEIKLKRELISLIERKNSFYELVRTLQIETAAVMTATYWQSPSFDYSVHSNAGILTGKVIGTINDYSRDQSMVGNEYQKEFAREFVGSWRALPISVFLTSSGMSALTTAIVFLLREQKFNGLVLVGQNSYFQNKELILKMCPKPVVMVDEQDLDKLFEAITKYQPRVIFLDTLTNSANLAMPNMNLIIKFLKKAAVKETYLIIDNTGTASGYQPLKALYPIRGKLKIIVWESLNKYYQYGLDRTIGGFVWCLPQDAGQMYYARMHAGTIMSDGATAMLPAPNRKQLNKRLTRLERNALILAKYLGKQCLYPKLRNHPAYAFAKDYGFGGSNLVVMGNGGVSQKKQILKKLMNRAKKMKVPLVAGTSFGLNTTRIYLTSLHSHLGEPFLRISAGTESRWEVEQLKQVFVW